jgi:hypothetical protein
MIWLRADLLNVKTGVRRSWWCAEVSECALRRWGEDWICENKTASQPGQGINCVLWVNRNGCYAGTMQTKQQTVFGPNVKHPDRSAASLVYSATKNSVRVVMQAVCAGVWRRTTGQCVLWHDDGKLCLLGRSCAHSDGLHVWRRLYNGAWWQSKYRMF